MDEYTRKRIIRKIREAYNTCKIQSITLFRDGSGAEFIYTCLLYTSPSPRDGATSRMPSSA